MGWKMNSRHGWLVEHLDEGDCVCVCVREREPHQSVLPPLVSRERAKEALMLSSRSQLVPMVGPVDNPVDEELTLTYMDKAKQASEYNESIALVIGLLPWTLLCKYVLKVTVSGCLHVNLWREKGWSYWVAPTSVYICPEARKIDNLSTALHELAEASPAASSYQVTVRLTGLVLFTYILSWNTWQYC